MNLTVFCRFNLWKLCPVGPTLIRNPFTFELVEPKKGVWDAVALEVSDNRERIAHYRLHIVGDQVEMYIGGHSLHWHPIVQIGLFELP
jgi:hypothetical protein